MIRRRCVRPCARRRAGPRQKTCSGSPQGWLPSSTRRSSNVRHRMDFLPQSPSAFEFRHIRYEKQPPVAQVIINRPDVLNALNFAALREMSRAFEDASWDDGIAAVIVTGAGDLAI